MSRFPLYNHKTFVQIWDSANDFINDPLKSAFNITMSNDTLSLVYHLIYAKYGNNAISNLDESQFRAKVFMIIYQYGPSWQKRVEIQDALRGLTSSDIEQGSKIIYNHAYNPQTTPSTSSTTELSYINEQNTTNYKKSKLDAYMQLWDLLATDVTGEFIGKFASLFNPFVVEGTYYVTEVEEEEEDDV